MHQCRVRLLAMPVAPSAMRGRDAALTFGKSSEFWRKRLAGASLPISMSVADKTGLILEFVIICKCQERDASANHSIDDLETVLIVIVFRFKRFGVIDV